MELFTAVLEDETGCEFSANVVAKDKEAAYDHFRDQYVESTILVVESPDDRADREHRTYMAACDDWDDDYTEDELW